jgi:hypothetical protein
MKKSELYAKYYLFNEAIEEIAADEFYSALDKNRDNSTFEAGSTCCYQVNTDGMRYYMFTPTFKSGGEYDEDTFFCKVKCITKAELKEIAEMFGAQY